MTSLKNWMKAHLRWSIALALLAALILWLVLKPTRHDYVYVTHAVDRGEVIARVTASGKVRALNTIKVGAEVSGQITQVFVDFNSPVTKGQVLAVIDPTRIRARVEQVRAQVALAEAALSTAQAGQARAQTDIEIQNREFARRRTLTERGFVSGSSLDIASSTLAAARAGSRTTAAQAASARAQIAQARAELSAAQLDLSRTTIVAPISGIVINKLVEPGTTVAASFQTPNLFEIAADTTRMQVEASVDEADIGQVRVGQGVRFTVDAYPNDRFAATVRQIRQAATEANNVVSYLIILDVDNRGGKLLPGMTANVDIVVGHRQNVLRAPTTAMRFRPRASDRPDGHAPSGTSVFVAGADLFKPARRAVVLGLRGEDFVEVRKGLARGERLLIRSRSTKPRDDKKDEPDDDDTIG